MSDDNKLPNPSAHNYSKAGTSPQDKPRRFKPITHDRDDNNVNEESARTTGTVRRNRPPAISTSSGGNYGILSSTAKDCC